MIHKEKVTIYFYNPQTNQNDRPMDFFVEVDMEKIARDVCGRARKSKTRTATALSGAVKVRAGF